MVTIVFYATLVLALDTQGVGQKSWGRLRGRPGVFGNIIPIHTSKTIECMCVDFNLVSTYIFWNPKFGHYPTYILHEPLEHPFPTASRDERFSVL